MNSPNLNWAGLLKTPITKNHYHEENLVPQHFIDN